MTTLMKWITEHSKTRIAMKKLTYIIAIATSVLAMASCQKEQNVTNSDDLTVVSFSTSEIQTKTAFGDKTAEGKYPTLWTGNEKVGVAYNGSVYKGNITSSTDGKSASFEIAIAQDANATNHNFYVISPADAFLSMNKDGAKGHIKIETTQTPGEGTCDPAAQVIAASHKSETFDTQINLAFSHVTAYGNLSIVLPEEAGAVSNISLTGSKNIAGRFYYDFNGSLEESTASSTISLLTSKVSDIFFACAPADLSGGKLDITVTTENGTYEKSIDLTGKTLKFESGIISKFTVNGFAKKEAPASWIATDLADITAADEVVITMAKGESVYALSAETDAKSNNPQAVLVTVKNGELTAAPADNLVWNIANDKGNLTIYPNGQTDKWLFAVSGDTKVKVGNSATNKIFTLDATTKYLKNTGANRYLGVYIDRADWRAYANTSNIAGQTLCFYVKGTPKTALETPANLQVSAEKVVSWDAVSGAASYNVTIGTETYTSNTNSYDAAAIADDYYDVAVVAVPSDKENYKNSAAATLTGVKFGTPTLATPTLKEGVIDGASISVSWSVDERATAGYNCELFKGGVKVGESKTVNAGAVTFTGLDAETAYVVKVNAIAVEGEKAYAASPVATLDVTTKAASATANDGSLERPYTAAEAIAAIDDDNTDLTGKHVKGIVTEVVSHNPSYGSMVYIIKSGEKTLKIFNGYDFGHTKFLGTDDLKVGDEVVVFGDLIKYNTTYELNTNNYLISINGETQIFRGLAVSEPKTAFNVGDTFELGGKVLQVWRGKEAVDVTTSATFSGYDMSTEGKQTVTVTVGDESVTYEIIVNPAGTAPSTTVTKTISDMSGNPTDGTKVSSMAMDDVITLSASTSGNNGKVYTNGAEWRLYQSNQGTMTVSSKAGYVIESIIVTFTNKYSGTLLYNGNVVTSGKAVSVSGSSVKFTLGNTSTNKNGQIKITAISVTYKQQ